MKGSRGKRGGSLAQSVRPSESVYRHLRRAAQRGLCITRNTLGHKDRHTELLSHYWLSKFDRDYSSSSQTTSSPDQSFPHLAHLVSTFPSLSSSSLLAELFMAIHGAKWPVCCWYRRSHSTGELCTAVCLCWLNVHVWMVGRILRSSRMFYSHGITVTLHKYSKGTTQLKVKGQASLCNYDIRFIYKEKGRKGSRFSKVELELCSLLISNISWTKLYESLIDQSHVLYERISVSVELQISTAWNWGCFPGGQLFFQGRNIILAR